MKGRRLLALALALATLPLSPCAEAGIESVQQAVEQVGARLAEQPGKRHKTRLRLMSSLMRLRQGAPVDQRDAEGSTALMLAAQAGETDIFRYLLGRGADPRLNAPRGVTLAMLAAEGGNEDIFHAIVGTRIPARATDAAGATLFQHACIGGNLNLCSEILHAGGDAFTVDRSGRTSVMYAAMGGNDALFYELVNRSGSNLRQTARDGTNLLIAAARGGSAAIVQTALNVGINPNAADSSGTTPLMEAARHGPDEIAALLLSHGANAAQRDRKGATAAMYAASTGHTRIFDLLHGSSRDAPDALGRTPLLYAVCGGDVRLVRRMLKEGADPTVLNKAAMSFAIACGHTEIALEVAARLPSTTHDDLSAIPLNTLGSALVFTRFVATHCNYPADRNAAATIYAQLCQGRDYGMGLSVHDASPKGNTPLQNAIAADFRGLVTFLLGAGADVNARSRAGTTALMTAVNSGSADLVRQLLDAGADVNAMSPGGTTALKLAAASGWLDMFNLLMEKGANPDLNCEGGASTLTCARSAGPEGAEIVRRLLGKPRLPTDQATAYAAIVEAMCADDSARFEELMKAWPDANATDASGRTLLIAAVQERVATNYIRRLLEAGADPNGADRQSRMPLDYVSTPAQRRILLEAGAIH